MSAPNVCERAGCTEPHKARGLCDKHYGRERGHRSRPDRVLATRARNRATALLVAAHRDEFVTLLATCTVETQVEAARLAKLCEESGKDPWQGIVRLRRGPKPDDQEPEDRIDLAATSSCDACAAFHRTGHACQACTDQEWEVSTPLDQLTPEQRIERALRAGKSARWIADAMIVPIADVLAVLGRLRAAARS